MKYLVLISLLQMAFFAESCGQNGEHNEENKKLFAKMGLEGVSLNAPLLYGYFFYNKEKNALEKLKKELLETGYQVVRLDKVEDKTTFILHVEKIEVHSVATINQREKELRILAQKYEIDSYDGWDVGNADPKKPLITNVEFETLVSAKNDNELFDFAINLYDNESFTKAAMAFDMCIQKKIKLDTSHYKLANCLVELDKIDAAIGLFEKATAINPLYYNAYFNLAAVCYDNKKFDKSIKNYRQTTLMNPKDSRAFYGLAAAQYANGNLKDSKINCDTALQLDPNNENALILKKMLKGK
jgi:tetratricopeptide (TPR) repeat protein